LPRIPLPTVDELTQHQRAVYEKVVSGPRASLVGPLRAALHSPELADRWQSLGALLRYQTSVPARLSELVILVTARRWNSQIEWHIHAAAARKAGLPQTIIEAIQHARSPEFESSQEAAVYEYAREIQTSGQVSLGLYEKVLAIVGVVGIVELTAIIGYYTMVSMTLNAHEIPLPDGAEVPLVPVARQNDGNSGRHVELTELSPARTRTESGSPNG
jgi:4-carboxymuconolactone decarboxylase